MGGAASITMPATAKPAVAAHSGGGRAAVAAVAAMAALVAAAARWVPPEGEAVTVGYAWHRMLSFITHGT